MINEEALKIINARQIIEGPQDRLRAIEPVKYPWARETWLLMLKNTWFPAEVSLGPDARQYLTLTDGQRQAYDRGLAFLSNLDAIQVSNIAENIVTYVTAPEIQLPLYRQIYEEALHVESYSTVIETVCTNPLEIYDMYRVNPVLQAKNDFVTAQANAIKTEGFTPENFVYALISNIILEGIYFYSGFLTFYTLARSGVMLETSNMIKFIQRDEMTHLMLFTDMFNALRQERPQLFTPRVISHCKELIDAGVNLEAAWGRHIIDGGVLGLTDHIVTDHIKSLADKRTQDIGFGTMYNVKDPASWVDKFSRIEKKDDNFFETKPTSYIKSGLDW